MKAYLLRTMVALLMPLQVWAALPPAAWNTAAPYATSTFEVRAQGNLYFSVSLDGHYYPNPVKKFSLTGVSAGMHALEIYVDGNGPYAAPKRLYSGNLYIEPGALVTGVVDNFGRFYIKSVKSLPAYAPEPYVPAPAPCQPPVYAPAPRPLPMSNAAFSQLMQVVDDQWFESGKIDVIGQAMRMNWFTTDQVVQMVKAMSFEDGRLDVAKMSYMRTVDPERYFLVNNAFWFSSSVDALSRYIAAL